ncbi:Imm21 family immunity protein [Singulisphaera acidiphila]|uniref:Imm21 family immunity protein n=1 Tax=Singulisphaera acidiphila TaxID=466153 RepID=UPI0012FB0407|nr:Imm21 family immunity protein [Singulisphaera acidiphila]
MAGIGERFEIRADGADIDGLGHGRHPGIGRCRPPHTRSAVSRFTRTDSKITSHGLSRQTTQAAQLYALALYWNGIVPPPGVPIPEGWVWGDPDGPVCDYDRAGDVDDYVGMVEVGPGFGLVLWDQPMRTAFIPSDDGGILVRWGHAYGEDEVWQAVGRAEEANWSQTEHRLQVSQGPLLVIDAAYEGSERPPHEGGGDPNWLEFTLPKGQYRVDFADFSPNERTWLILVRLSRTLL